MKRKRRKGVEERGIVAEHPSLFSAAQPTHRDHLHHCLSQTCRVVVVVVKHFFDSDKGPRESGRTWLEVGLKCIEIASHFLAIV